MNSNLVLKAVSVNVAALPCSDNRVCKFGEVVAGDQVPFWSDFPERMKFVRVYRFAANHGGDGGRHQARSVKFHLLTAFSQLAELSQREAPRDYAGGSGELILPFVDFVCIKWAISFPYLSMSSLEIFAMVWVEAFIAAVPVVR